MHDTNSAFCLLKLNITCLTIRKGRWLDLQKGISARLRIQNVRHPMLL